MGVRTGGRGNSWSCLSLLLLVLLLAKPARVEAGVDSDVDAWLGRYAMELRVATTAKMPLLPTEQSTTVSLLLVDIQRGSRSGMLTQRHHVCDVRVEGSSAVRMVIPPAFVSGLQVRRYPAVLRPGDDGWGYRADMGVEAIGYDPAVTGGGLPDAIGDPGVQDTDEDGSPGATVELRVPAVGRVRLFIAQRSHLVLKGVQTGEDRIEGDVDIRLLEQRTLGAQPGFFNRTPAIRPDAPRSGFTLVRVADATDCEGLTRKAVALFR